MSSLAGKVVAVTGAASGMGLATAARLYAHGARLSVADINQEALSKAVDQIKAKATGGTSSGTPEILTTVVDVRQSKQVDAWIDKTVKHFGRLDAAANIAGVLGKNFGVGDLTEIDDDEFDYITSVNFKGVFNCLRAELRVMEKGASVVNASSTTGLEGHPKNSVYSATKHAVVGLTKSAAGEVGARGIRVNCVAPGIIRTPMVASLDADKLDSVFSRVPLARVAEPDEAANIFTFLLSDEASYVTGSAFVVDGGMLS
ncbi:hypothetical protein A1O3_06692 [Capronia epimyces CBS 606.96]|uniref:3-oxoacyl-[acyl-carrier protein] reductase n=1 Tax=Capronia epimyces CBS 606.96 TaxID=1182542 RepID=W9Y0Y9_9EURO|nr:uncharacterized protein A1O3_06692 [Capronia epimyces CBS 606.96]EXJ82876.1 hypothetical protein A1O3_06692 [Capronia epimyces CBS 606.96]